MTIQEISAATQTPFSGIYCVGDVQRMTARNGKDYWNFTVKDPTGQINGKIWTNRNTGRLEPDTLTSGFAELSGKKDDYGLSISSIRTLSESEVASLDLSAYMPYDTQEDFRKLKELARSELTYAPWRRLYEGYFEDPQCADSFCRATAAKSMHHTGIGGLVRHTYEVCRICLGMCDIFADLDRQTLLVAALFHDIGKTLEMSASLFETGYTEEGNLIGHVVLGVQLIAPRCKAAGVPEPLERHLMHLILSHHGKLEFGSPKEPFTKEALVLSAADDLDAKLNGMDNQLKNIQQGCFLDWSRPHNHPLYQPVRTQDIDIEQPASQYAASRAPRERTSQAQESAPDADEEGHHRASESTPPLAVTTPRSTPAVANDIAIAAKPAPSALPQENAALLQAPSPKAPADRDLKAASLQGPNDDLPREYYASLASEPEPAPCISQPMLTLDEEEAAVLAERTPSPKPQAAAASPKDAQKRPQANAPAKEPVVQESTPKEPAKPGAKPAKQQGKKPQRAQQLKLF